MVGTILGVPITCMYVIALGIVSLVQPLLREIQFDDILPYRSDDASRYIEAFPVIISNLFYLEAAYEEIQEIRRNREETSYTSYLKRIFCC